MDETLLARFRKLSGDTGIDDERDVQDEEIEAYYEETGGLFAATMVKILQQRMGVRINDVNTSGDLGQSDNSDVFMRIRDELLPYWEGQAEKEAAGVSPTHSGLVVGGLSLGIDTECEA